MWYPSQRSAHPRCASISWSLDGQKNSADYTNGCCLKYNKNSDQKYINTTRNVFTNLVMLYSNTRRLFVAFTSDTCHDANWMFINHLYLGRLCFYIRITVILNNTHIQYTHVKQLRTIQVYEITANMVLMCILNTT